MRLTVQKLFDILSDKEEVPYPERAELCFYLKKENGDEVDLELVSIGAFSISTDITMTFKENNWPKGFETNESAKQSEAV